VTGCSAEVPLSIAPSKYIWPDGVVGADSCSVEGSCGERDSRFD